MRLLFKQRFFSWFDSYDIYDETGNVVYTVEGKLSWGHCLHILDAAGNHIGTVQERVFTFLPKFEGVKEISNFYQMLPYIVTMIVLIFTSKNSQAPKAEGIPYDKGSR